MASETKLFDVRTTGRSGQKAQLRERVTQLKEEIAGLTAQAQAKDQEIALVNKELVGVRQLYDQHLVQLTRLTTLERDAARLAGEKAQYVASTAQAKGKITETELQIIQIDKDMVSDVSKDLRETNDKIGEYIERKVTAEDQLRRVDIRAPQDGVVEQSTVHTVGGVIQAGDAIMMVVPQADDLQVEAKVNPQDIDKLQIGEKTLLRLSAFNQRTTPELTGEVIRVSPDVNTDQRSGQSYYTIRVSLPPDEVAKLGEVEADPGHAGGSLRPDRRPHHDVLSGQAAEGPVDACLPRAVRPPRGPGLSFMARLVMLAAGAFWTCRTRNPLP